MSMTKTEVKQMLFAAVDAAVHFEGFRGRKSDLTFTRPIAGGRQSLAVALWDFAPRFEFTASMGVRLDEVESLIHPFAGTDPRYQAETLTSLTQLEFLGVEETSPNQGAKFGGETEAELKTAADRLVAILVERVLPFFDEYRDLAALDRGLNPEGIESAMPPIWPVDRSRFDDSNEPYRQMHGIAVAYLNRNPRLPALIEAYRGQLTGLVDPIGTKYESFATHIAAQKAGDSST